VAQQASCRQECALVPVDLLAAIVPVRDQCSPPFFCGFSTLWLSMMARSGWLSAAAAFRDTVLGARRGIRLQCRHRSTRIESNRDRRLFGGRIFGSRATDSQVRKENVTLRGRSPPPHEPKSACPAVLPPQGRDQAGATRSPSSSVAQIARISQTLLRVANGRGSCRVNPRGPLLEFRH